MHHGHQAAHHRHARAPFDFPSPQDIWSAIEEPFKAKTTSTTQQKQQKTSTSVVYSTMPTTFSGPVGGYITPTAAAKSDDDDEQSTTSKASAKETTTSSTLKTSASKTSGSSATSTAKSTSSETKSVENTNSLLLAKQTSPQTSSSASASATAAANSLSQGTSTGGMTSGAKAGMAIGIIGGLAAVFFLAFFLVRRYRKAAERESADHEKSSSGYDPNPFSDPVRATSTRTASTAPRLSLRPVTQFLPNLGDKRSSRGNVLGAASAAAPMTANRSVSPQNAWNRPTTSNSQARENPFGNHAEAVDPVNAAGPATVEGVSASGQLMSGAVGGAAAGAVVAGVAVGLKRGASKRGNGPQPFDFTKNNPNVGNPSGASPTGTDYSMSEAQNTPTATGGTAVIAAAGGPQNTSVHRVQLDFKPSMDDELELRSGQLIRLLHEYDDGWALCIRLDRSQQGVAPRTCLSTRPVKPRPTPGPNGMPRGNPPPGMRVPGHVQQGRGMSPAMNMGPRPQSPAGGPQGRSMTPNGGPQGRSMTPQGQPMGHQGRPMTPQGHPMAPNGRPMTPTGGPQARSMSPGPRNSPQGHERRITPPGPSRMNPTPAYAPSPKDVPLPSDSPAPAANHSPKTSPQNSISYAPVGRKPVPGQAA